MSDLHDGNGSAGAPRNAPSRRRVIQTAAALGGVVAGAAGLNLLAPEVIPETPWFGANDGFWARALPAADAPLATDLDADVVIVGGGFLGLSTAYNLRRRLPHARIVLLEAVRCGNGASGRNGGMVLTMTEDRYMEVSREPAIDRRLYALTAANIPAMADLARGVGIDCELEQHGALHAFEQPDLIAEKQAYAETARGQGLPIEFWDADRVAATVGARGYAGALFDPGSGQVHPGKLVAVWKAAALREGAEIFDATPVVRIETGPVHRLHTAAGQVVRAPILVLATNAYSSKLGFLRQAVAPVFDNVCITPPLDEARFAEAGWKALIPFDDSRTEVFYAARTRDNRIHFGGGPVDYAFNNGLRTPSNMPARYAGVHREFAKRFPALADVPFESCWCGAVDMSLDSSPAVGHMGAHGNIYYGIGFSGHGVNLTSVFGRIIGDLIAGDHDAWSWLPFLDRLPPYVPNEPFRWIGVESALALLSVTGA